MDKGTQSLLNLFLSVLAPVLILEHCSAQGEALWQLGPAWAMVVALALPIGCGVWTFAEQKKADAITVLGFIGTILTGVVTLYATTGEGAAIRPDTPWWYAAKEALIAGLLGVAVLLTAKRRDSLLRLFVYSDGLFDIRSIESKVAEQGAESAYNAVLRRASLYTALSLLLSAVANFLFSLYFLLPVLELPAAEQAVAYNEAVGTMMWWGYLVIGVPLLATLFGVIRYLQRALSALTGLERDRISMM